MRLNLKKQGKHKWTKEGWIGTDLDGTLAEYHGWDDGKIGKAIPKMLERVKKWIADGQEVRIVTARVSAGTSKDIKAIADWLEENDIGGLDITNEKDHEMTNFGMTGVFKSFLIPVKE
ncbi:hypothetical protein LCGC14_2010920 [marine sediment metagenome]|uniref:Uncharacterized protein n=1 Tax=marine sediment metagenome TaxID=412755 RepID=A0A0F9F0C9_9ZZZZ